MIDTNQLATIIAALVQSDTARTAPPSGVAGTMIGKYAIIRSRNEAFNQYGELVFSFVIDILAERRPDS